MRVAPPNPSIDEIGDVVRRHWGGAVPNPHYVALGSHTNDQLALVDWESGRHSGDADDLVALSALADELVGAR